MEAAKAISDLSKMAKLTPKQAWEASNDSSAGPASSSSSDDIGRPIKYFHEGSITQANLHIIQLNIVYLYVAQVLVEVEGCVGVLDKYVNCLDSVLDSSSDSDEPKPKPDKDIGTPLPAKGTGDDKDNDKDKDPSASRVPQTPTGMATGPSLVPAVS